MQRKGNIELQQLEPELKQRQHQICLDNQALQLRTISICTYNRGWQRELTILLTKNGKENHKPC